LSVAPVSVSVVKILHTSDWHLGRTLHGVDLHEHQEAFLDHLVETVKARDIDAVLVSGDVYDRAVPGVQTVKLLSAGLARLSAVTRVILTPGNHDSAVRLGFAAGLMRENIRILADVSGIGEPVVVSGDHGDLLVYGIPYLDPDAARSALTADGAEPPARSHQGVLTAAMDRIRANLEALKGSRPRASIVMAHAFVAGGEASESERDISIGGVNVVPSAVFAGVDYVALGHLHGAQEVKGMAMARYSGSPLAYSFSEIHQHKSSVLLEFGADGPPSVELIPTPVPRHLAEVRAPMASLLSGDHDGLADDWLRVYVTDASYPDNMFARVKERFPYALAVLHEPEGLAEHESAPQVTEAMDPMIVTADFVAFATNTPPDEGETAVLQRAYDDVRAADRSA